MEFDEVLKRHVGEFGRWQKVLTFLLGLYGFFDTFVAFDMIFTSAHVDSSCLVVQSRGNNFTQEEWKNLTVPWQKHNDEWRRHPCHAFSPNATDSFVNGPGHNFATATTPGDVTEASLPERPKHAVEGCIEYEYDNTTYLSTVITEWDLVCDQAYLVSILKSATMGGMMCGAGIGGILADRFGRRRVFVVAVPMVVAFKLAQCFSPNMAFFTACNTLAMFSVAIVYIVVFTLGVELVGPSRRALVGTWLAEAYAIGYLVLVLLGFLLRSWRSLVYTVTALLTPTLALVFIIPESPRWLLSRGDVTQATKVLRRIAHLNGRSLPDDVCLAHPKNTDTGEIRWWHLLATRRLFLRSFLIFLAWFTAAFIYYGLTLNMGALSGNLYVNMAVAATLELLSYFLNQLVINSRLGRRCTTSGLYVVSGLALLCTLAIPTDAQLVATLLMIFGRFCVCCFYNSLYIWTAELLPTPVRNTGLSINSCLGKIGAVLAPFTVHLELVHPTMPVIAQGGLTFLCGLLLLLLPETRGKPLPQSMADITRKTDDMEMDEQIL